ncbi:SH3 domain-containing protein [Heterostelium album PN500]|uniref:SH3 domain-containing protein n=1 Tax=Heterostelium pallidum (strain ATCC 26659 / Pp 5 / PN500) TaxID=670386 RepID=D3B574_HETP5|nr:SH3 domain-containing protein [Heterostelium album PN500]EFA83439.1 SH3 domain-containing protein [Heterostelium album PN500]|eukprot:XP_020435556.1 SH3 domain-containing protein [Heterostelium album PN500]
MLYTWHQSNNTVVITFSTPARISREDVIAELSDGVNFQAGVDGYVLHIDGVLSAACKSTVKVNLKEDANQAILTLDKQSPGKWSALLSEIAETAVPRARVLFDYVGSGASEEEGELAPLYANELLQVVAKDESGWWEGIKLQMSGVFPSNFVDDFEHDYQEQEDVEASSELTKFEESQQPINTGKI